RVDYIERRQALRLQRGGIQIYLNLALFTAIGIGHGCARHGYELRPNKIQAIVVELLLRQVLPREGQLENRHTRCAISKDQDRKSTRLNSSHVAISYAVFCLKKKNTTYNKSTNDIVCS